MAVQIDVTYDGELQCTSVHGPSGDRLATDAPVDNHGKGLHFSPTDLLATSLGSCMVTTLAIAANTRSITLAFARASVTKEMGAQPRRHVAKLGVHITLPANLDDKARTILERAAAGCPVSASLADTTVVDLRFTYA